MTPRTHLLLTITTFLTLLTKSHHSTCPERNICEFVNKSYFSFQEMNNTVSTYPLKDGIHSISTSWCENDNRIEKCPLGNLLFQDQKNGAFRCLSLDFSKLELAKKGTKLGWKQLKINRGKKEELETFFRSKMTKFRLNTVVRYTHPIKNKEIISLGVKTVILEFQCSINEENLNLETKTQIYDKSQELLVFRYNGIYACGFLELDPINEMKNQKVLCLSLSLLAFCTLIYSQRNPKMAMAISGGQTGILISLYIIANIEDNYDFSRHKVIIAALCSFLGGLVISFVSSYSLRMAVVVQGINLGIVCSLLLFWVLAMAMGLGIMELEFYGAVVGFSLVFCSLSFWKKFVQVYSLNVFTNLSQPFYLVFGVAMALDIYPEIFSLRQAKEIGYKVKLSPYNWVCMGVEGVLTGACFCWYGVNYIKGRRDGKGRKGNSDVGGSRFTIFDTFVDYESGEHLVSS